jgi:hypothetical protein
VRALFVDTYGLAVLAIQLVAVFHWLVPGDNGRVVEIALSFIVLANICFYLWHAEKSSERLSEPSDWLGLIGVSIVGAAISFGLDMRVGLVFHPKLSPIQAGTKAGGPFGFALTMLLCPGLTTVASRVY